MLLHRINRVFLALLGVVLCLGLPVAVATDITVSTAVGQQILSNGDSLTVTGTGSVTANGYDYPDSAIYAPIGSNYNTITLESGSVITTSGFKVFGIDCKANSTITANGSITTSGELAHGIYCNNDNNTITASGSITTSGERAYGIYCIQDKNTITASGSITTSGKYAYGIYSNYKNTITASGSITTSGEEAHGIFMSMKSNVAHVSGTISVSGLNSYALYSGNGANNTFHILNGASLNGGIYSSSTSYLTFGYAKDGSNKAALTAVDDTFSITLNDSITVGSSGLWDGYFAGGTTTLNGAGNQFRNIYVGADCFTHLDVNSGDSTSYSIDRIVSATATLNVTNSITTTGKVTIGAGSTYNLLWYP